MSSFDVSDARTNIDLNADTDGSQTTSKRSPCYEDRWDATKRSAQGHANEVGKRAQELAELNLIAKERVEVQREHLDLFRRQAREERDHCEQAQMRNQLAILRSSEEGSSPQDFEVLPAIKENIGKTYLRLSYFLSPQELGLPYFLL